MSENRYSPLILQRLEAQKCLKHLFKSEEFSFSQLEDILIVLTEDCKFVAVGQSSDIFISHSNGRKCEKLEFSRNRNDFVTALIWMSLTNISSPILIAGFSSGIIRCFDGKTHSLLTSQLLHNESVHKLKVVCRTNSFLKSHSPSHAPLMDLIILQGSILSCVDGRSIKRCIEAKLMNEEDEQKEKNSWTFTKWSLNNQSEVLDVTLCAPVEPLTFGSEHLERIDALNMMSSSPHLIAVGHHPMIAYYKSERFEAPGLTSTAIASTWKLASKVTSAMYSFARSLIWSNNQHQEDPQNDVKDISEEDMDIQISQIKIADASQIKYQRCMKDSTRVISTIFPDPFGKFAVTTDKFGRVMLIDMLHFVIIHIWKGYRMAQCGWIEEVQRLFIFKDHLNNVDNDTMVEMESNKRIDSNEEVKWNTNMNDRLKSKKIQKFNRGCLVIYEATRGIMEIWRIRGFPCRIGSLNVGLGYTLIYKQKMCFLVHKDGDIFSVGVNPQIQKPHPFAHSIINKDSNFDSKSYEKNENNNVNDIVAAFRRFTSYLSIITKKYSKKKNSKNVDKGKLGSDQSSRNSNTAIQKNGKNINGNLIGNNENGSLQTCFPLQYTQLIESLEQYLALLSASPSLEEFERIEYILFGYRDNKEVEHLVPLDIKELNSVSAKTAASIKMSTSGVSSYGKKGVRNKKNMALSVCVYLNLDILRIIGDMLGSHLKSLSYQEQAGRRDRSSISESQYVSILKTKIEIAINLQMVYVLSLKGFVKSKDEILHKLNDVENSNPNSIKVTQYLAHFIPIASFLDNFYIKITSRKISLELKDLIGFERTLKLSSLLFGMKPSNALTSLFSNNNKGRAKNELVFDEKENVLVEGEGEQDVKLDGNMSEFVSKEEMVQLEQTLSNMFRYLKLVQFSPRVLHNMFFQWFSSIDISRLKSSELSHLEMGQYVDTDIFLNNKFIDMIRNHLLILFYTLVLSFEPLLLRDDSSTRTNTYTNSKSNLKSNSQNKLNSNASIDGFLGSCLSFCKKTTQFDHAIYLAELCSKKKEDFNFNDVNFHHQSIQTEGKNNNENEGMTLTDWGEDIHEKLGVLTHLRSYLTNVDKTLITLGNFETTYPAPRLIALHLFAFTNKYLNMKSSNKLRAKLQSEAEGDDDTNMNMNMDAYSNFEKKHIKRTVSIVKEILRGAQDPSLDGYNNGESPKEKLIQQFRHLITPEFGFCSSAPFNGLRECSEYMDHNAEAIVFFLSVTYLKQFIRSNNPEADIWYLNVAMGLLESISVSELSGGLALYIWGNAISSQIQAFYHTLEMHPSTMHIASLEDVGINIDIDIEIHQNEGEGKGNVDDGLSSKNVSNKEISSKNDVMDKQAKDDHAAKKVLFCNVIKEEWNFDKHYILDLLKASHSVLVFMKKCTERTEDNKTMSMYVDKDSELCSTYTYHSPLEGEIMNELRQLFVNMQMDLDLNIDSNNTLNEKKSKKVNMNLSNLIDNHLNVIQVMNVCATYNVPLTDIPKPSELFPELHSLDILVRESAVLDKEYQSKMNNKKSMKVQEMKSEILLSRNNSNNNNQEKSNIGNSNASNDDLKSYNLKKSLKLRMQFLKKVICHSNAVIESNFWGEAVDFIGLAKNLKLNLTEIKNYLLLVLYAQGKDNEGDEILMQMEEKHIIIPSMLRIAVTRFSMAYYHLEKDKQIASKVIAAVPQHFWLFLQEDNKKWHPPMLSIPFPDSRSRIWTMENAFTFILRVVSLVKISNVPNKIREYCDSLQQLILKIKNVIDKSKKSRKQNK